MSSSEEGYTFAYQNWKFRSELRFHYPPKMRHYPIIPSMLSKAPRRIREVEQDSK